MVPSHKVCGGSLVLLQIGGRNIYRAGVPSFIVESHGGEAAAQLVINLLMLCISVRL